MKKILMIFLAAAMFTTVALAQHKPRQYSVTYERFNANPPALSEIGKLNTYTDPAKFNTRWSIGCECLDRDYSFFDGYKDYLPELGVAYARIQSGWARCEKEKGVYDFEWLDRIVDGIIAKGLKPWMCICYGNPIYGADHDLSSRVFTDDETMNAWKKYVEALVKHFKGRIVMWEVWNEPNHMNNAKFPEPYANLLINTAKIIRKLDKDTKIAGLSLSWFIRLDFTKQVFERLKATNNLDLIDYVTFHPYYHNPDQANWAIGQLDSLVKSYNPNIRLYQGESGCPSRLEFTHALHTIEWTEYSQAKWMARRMANDFMWDMPASIFSVVDHTYKNMQQSYGMFRTDMQSKVIYRRPVMYTVRHMASILRPEVKAVKMECTANTSRELSCLGLEKDGQVIGAMLWFSDERPSDSLEREKLAVTIKNLRLEYPVYIEPITGKVYNLNVYYGSYSDGDMNLQELPVWDSPVIIMEKKHVDMTKTADHNYLKSPF